MLQCSKDLFDRRFFCHGHCDIVGIAECLDFISSWGSNAKNVIVMTYRGHERFDRYQEEKEAEGVSLSYTSLHREWLRAMTVTRISDSASDCKVVITGGPPNQMLFQSLMTNS